MSIKLLITYDDKCIYNDIYRDDKLRMTSIIYGARSLSGSVKIKTHADLEDFTVSEMRDLWGELKKPYISPHAIMEQIRADVLKHLQDVGRVDLVAICLDNASYGGVTMRL